jgi:4'-phosphopantetheinyl transferase EntD
MQAVETETLILYHTDLRGEWPEEAARALAARLPYAKRLAVVRPSARARESLAGIALALRALSTVMRREVSPRELVFPEGGKPHLTHTRDAACEEQADFSIAHSAPFVGCAALARGRVGLDIEVGESSALAHRVAREAALKAAGLTLAAYPQVELEAGAARCGGERWHARALADFAGASACLMTSRRVARLEARAIALADLFR